MKKTTINGSEYMEYSYREAKKIHKIRISIDESSDLEELEFEMIKKIFKTRWKRFITKITENYHDQFYTLPKPIQIKNLQNFGVRFTHNTNKIEGSSLSLQDVVGIIKDGITPFNKPLEDTFEAKKHMDVYEMMCNESYDLDWERVLKWHKVLFHETKRSIAGTFREYPVGIAGSNYTPPMGKDIIEIELEKLLEFWKKQKNTLNPVLLSCIMHFRFVSIHPFGDGNGRISRVLMNYILYHSKYPMFDIPASIRRTYFSALERSNVKPDETIFVQWFMRNYIKENKKYL